jgi:hypothetical protein
MSCGYNPNTSIFAGMSTTALQTALNNAQQAYIDLTTGGKVQVAAYTQGDGTRSVTYTRANIADLVATIKQLQAQLGIIRRARRPIRPLYT